eukprot:2873408-Alexandrium_andersonii.AAC.1
MTGQGDSWRGRCMRQPRCELKTIRPRVTSGASLCGHGRWRSQTLPKLLRRRRALTTASLANSSSPRPPRGSDPWR